MTDLEKLLAGRDPALCRLLAFRAAVGPWGIAGFVLYGLLYLVAAAFVAVGVLFAAIALSPHTPDGRVTGVVAWLHPLLFWGAFLLAWIPFAFWVRGRVRRTVAGALPLFEDGLILDGTIASVDVRVGAKGARQLVVEVAFLHEGKEQRWSHGVFGFHPRAGDRLPILYLPGQRMAAIFPLVDGKMRPIGAGAYGLEL